MNDALAIRGTMFIDRRLVRNAALVVRGGTIEQVGNIHDVAISEQVQWLDDNEGIVVPGFIDIHIHGSGGHRVEDEPIGVARHIVRNGTTLFLPTLLTNELSEMIKAAERITACGGLVKGGATIGGIHLEGPFLNPRYGAQMARHNVDPTSPIVLRLIDACGGGPKLVTLAPELPGAIRAIECFRQAGAVVSIGHSDADEVEYRRGRDAGLTHATHLFNAMPPRHWLTASTYCGCKPIGVEELILADDDVSADVLCDATCSHVHKSLLTIALACKGIEKLSLITDAMPASGQGAGEFKLADGQSIFTTDDEDVARLANGLLCGSVLSMCGTIRNWMNHTGGSLEQALVMATEAPARAINVFDRKGSITAGKDADLVWLNAEHQVTRTMIRGRIEYQAQVVTT